MYGHFGLQGVDIPIQLIYSIQMRRKSPKEKKIVACINLSPKAWALVDGFMASYAFQYGRTLRSRSAAMEMLLEKCFYLRDCEMMHHVWYDGKWRDPNDANEIRVKRMQEEFYEKMKFLSPAFRRMELESWGMLTPKMWYDYQVRSGLEIDGANMYDPAKGTIDERISDSSPNSRPESQSSDAPSGEDRREP